MVKSLRGAVLFAGVFAVSAADAAAQYEPWSFSVEADGGVFFPTKAYGKNGQLELTDDPGLQALQPSAEAQAAPMIGAGVRLQFPNPGIALRVSAYTTTGATVESRTPACDILDPIDGLWETFRCVQPFEEDVRVSEVLARMSFKQGAAERTLGVAVEIGLGVRLYDFGGATCPVNLTTASRFICERADQLTINQAQPLLIFGFAVEYMPGPVGAFLRVQDQVSPYGGDASGDPVSQNDLLVSAGLSFNFR